MRLNSKELVRALRDSVDSKHYRFLFFVTLALVLLLEITFLFIGAASGSKHRWEIISVYCIVYGVMFCPFPIFNAVKAFIFDPDPAHYVMADVELLPCTDGMFAANRFDVYIVDESGEIIRVKTKAIFKNASFGLIQYRNYVNNQARVAYHLKKNELWVLELLDKK